VARGDHRDIARNELQNLTSLKLLQWLTMRSVATELMLSVALNEKGFSLSSLCRNCIRIHISFSVGRWGEFNWPAVLPHRIDLLSVTLGMNPMANTCTIGLPNISPWYPGPSSRLLPCTFSSLSKHCLGWSQGPPGGRRKLNPNVHRDNNCDRKWGVE
jgi:hypothetical protein